MYAIGLDIGIASVGYAVVSLDAEENPCDFIRLGVRIFDAAEESKTGASLALPRREARSARRRTRRHRHRLERIKQLLVKSGLIDEEGLKSLFAGKLSDIYALRVSALDSRIEDSELCRVLIHLAQRRGFKSNRKSELTKDKEAGQLLTAVNENKVRMSERGYRTVAEMLLKDERFAECKRNKGGSYITTVERDQIEDEARKILKAQRDLGNEKVTDELTEKYITILTSQRRFDEGPGKPSPYAGDQIGNMIGKCVFEPEEPRAAKACYSFEYFNLLQKVNHLYLVRGGERKQLTSEQRWKIIRLAHKKARQSKTSLNYSQIRKELELGNDTLFNTVLREDYIEREKKTKFDFLPAYHKISRALDKVSNGAIESLTNETLDGIGRIVATYKGDEKRMEEFKKLKELPKEYAETLLEVDHSRFCHLSLKALRKITPFLEEGMTYDKACKEAGYNFRAHAKNEKSHLLPAHVPEMDDITSPVARRAISQTIKVINAIIREQNNSPAYINVELAREMAKSFDERKDIERHNEDNRARNESLKKQIREDFGIIEPKGLDIVKFKLGQEQDGISPYSRRHIDCEKLFEPGYVDVDHIIPYSICFDDSYRNKVLVFSSENRDKGNRLPLDYLRSKYGDEAVHDFIGWVTEQVHDRKKRTNLLKEKLTDDDIQGFKERNLQDTKTISRFMLNFIRDYLAFAPSHREESTVTAINGAMTAYLRKRWGLNKTREDGDLHHALDAAVIACVTQFMVNKVSTYAKNNENWLQYASAEDVERRLKTPFPLPWGSFRKELTAISSENPAMPFNEKLPMNYARPTDGNAIKPIFVSRMPNHKVTGEAHEATIRSQMPGDEGFYVTKKPLTDLKLDKKTGEIENYYNPDADRPLYDALKARLQEFGGDAKKAFAGNFYRPGTPGTPGRLVKKVKIREKATLTVPVHRNPAATDDGEQLPTAVASNGAMVRVDVFYVEGDGYYLVPIYVADTIKPELPNKAIVAHKDFCNWAVMKDEDFLFSLYPNDLIKVRHKKKIPFSRSNKKSTLPDKFETNEAFVYYKNADIAAGTIAVILHDNSYKTRLGVKTLAGLEKYQVDVLGNVTKVKKELRNRFH